MKKKQGTLPRVRRLKSMKKRVFFHTIKTFLIFNLNIFDIHNIFIFLIKFGKKIVKTSFVSVSVC